MAFARAQTSGLGPVYDPDPAKLQNTDSLRRLLSQTTTDTTRADLFILLATAYFLKNQDSALWYTQQATELAQKINYQRGQFGARTRMALLHRNAGNYSKAVQLVLTNLQIAERFKDTLRMYFMNQLLSGISYQMNDFVRQLAYARKVQKLVHSGYFKTQNDVTLYSQRGYLAQIASAFESLNKLDSALFYWQHSYKAGFHLKDTQGLAIATSGIGATLSKKGRYKEAFSYYRMAINYAQTTGSEHVVVRGRQDILAQSQLGLAKLFHQKYQLDSALYYGRVSLNTYRRLKLPAQELKVVSFFE